MWRGKIKRYSEKTKRKWGCAKLKDKDRAVKEENITGSMIFEYWNPILFEYGNFGSKKQIAMKNTHDYCYIRNIFSSDLSVIQFKSLLSFTSEVKESQQARTR